VGGGIRAAVDPRRALVRRGEVWWVDHPEAGRRLHPLLTRDAPTPVLTSVLAVPATRTIRGIPTEVLLGPEDGMPAECALSLDNVTVLPKSLLTDRIAALGPERVASVCRALAVATECGT
jgi:mRNA interferase MazF